MTAFATPGEIVDAFEAALNAKDAAAVGQVFTPDAEFVNIMGMRMRGREGIVSGHAWAFSGPLRGSTVRFDQVDELPVTRRRHRAARSLRPRARKRRSAPNAPARHHGLGLRRAPGLRRLAGRRGHERHRGDASQRLTPGRPLPLHADRQQSHATATTASRQHREPPRGWLHYRVGSSGAVRHPLLRRALPADQTPARPPTRTQGRPDRPLPAAHRRDLAHAHPQPALRSGRRPRRLAARTAHLGNAPPDEQLRFSHILWRRPSASRHNACQRGPRPVDDLHMPGGPDRFVHQPITCTTMVVCVPRLCSRIEENNPIVILLRRFGIRRIIGSHGTQDSFGSRRSGFKSGRPDRRDAILQSNEVAMVAGLVVRRGPFRLR